MRRARREFDARSEPAVLGEGDLAASQQTASEPVHVEVERREAAGWHRE
jgi:hypothetical protein